MNTSTLRFLRSRFLPGALALSLLAGACVSDDRPSATPGTNLSSDEIELTAARLETADSCDALLDRLIAEGVERVGPYGFGNGYWGFPEIMVEGDAMEADMAMEESSADEAFESAPATTDQGSSDRFSGTNNQEVNVEEADRVKTDGQRIIIMRGNSIEVVDVTGDAPKSVRTIELEDETWGSEMFLVGDKVLLLSSGWSAVPFASDLVGSRIRPEGLPTSRLTLIDITTGAAEASIEIEGNYLSAREVDGSIRIVTTSALGNFAFLYPSNEGAEDAAIRANRQLIEESTIEQWIPTFRQTVDGDVVAEGQAFDCTDMYLPSEFSGFGALSVLTVDIEDGLTLEDSLGVMSDGQTVYASTSRLTVASNRFPEWDWRTGEIVSDDEDFTTSLHSFDISTPGATTYVGSGSVQGSLLNQYSLSEHNGYLRVATTDGAAWNRSEDSQSMVTVLEERDDELVRVGFVDGLGLGEQIFAVRFMGDVGYVVTFRQIDPLYTLDLSDPSAPTVLGELKIPGFSTYLHPVGDGSLLGVGQDASEEGFTTGAQVSLFDVSDLSAPQRVDQIGFGENSYSSVDWDPKAFLFWGERSLAVIPVSAWSYNEDTGEERSQAQAVLVRINDDRTLTELGRIGHPIKNECESYYLEEEVLEAEAEAAEAEAVDAEAVDAEAELVESETLAIEPAPPVDDYCWSYQPEIQRSVVVGDAIYTISESGIQKNELDDLDAVSWLAF